MILSLLGSWQAKLAVLGVTGILAFSGGAWLAHRLDTAALDALRLADAQKIIATQQADARALAEFQVRQATAQQAAGQAITAARDAQVRAETRLSAALVEAQNEARKNHEQNQPTAGACLSVKLPDSVLNALAH